MICYRLHRFLKLSNRCLFDCRVKLCNSKMATLESLQFDNLALRSLPLDEEKENFVRQVPGACFSLVSPTPVTNPQTVVYSKSAFSLIDLPETELQRKDFAEYFSGNKLLPGSKTAAHCYCGHQFGHFSGQLGDGAAMYLGEVINNQGDRWEVQLKGAGLTPYSRHADGRKVLRSSIREFLCSEAMHHLGIPTTRAACCITSETAVPRDVFYNGNTIAEKATIVMRMAPTFLRFGSFEIFKPMDKVTGRQGPSVGRVDILHQMLDYTINTFFKEIHEAHPSSNEDKYLAFYKEVVIRTAKLVALWQSVGFCHGVLNTDNMSIVGATVDYGPFGFMDYFNRDHICNESDSDRGRYSYRAQPEMCKWNLEKLGEALQGALPLEKSKAALEELYDKEFHSAYLSKMRLKLGLLNHHLSADEELIESLFDTMQETGADFTNTFNALKRVQPAEGGKSAEINKEVVQYIASQCQTAEELRKTLQPSMGDRQLQMFLMLIQSNPTVMQQLGGSIGLIQTELDKMEKLRLIKDMKSSDKIEKDAQVWSEWISKYSARVAEEYKSVEDPEQAKKEHENTMKLNNPRFVLRNYIAQNAITSAEKGDFSEVHRVLKLLESPYGDDIDLSLPGQTKTSEEHGASCSVPTNPAQYTYDQKPPDWSLDLRVT